MSNSLDELEARLYETFGKILRAGWSNGIAPQDLDALILFVWYLKDAPKDAFTNGKTWALRATERAVQILFEGEKIAAAG